MANSHVIPSHYNFKDMHGLRFGRWLVLSFVDSGGSGEGARWLCRCDCGTERIVKASGLRRGKSSSCGCRHRDIMEGREASHSYVPPVVESIGSEIKSPEGCLHCSRCKEHKPIDQFRVRPGRPTSGVRQGRWSFCNECDAARAKTPHARRLANGRSRKSRNRLKEADYIEFRKRERESNLKRKYGIVGTMYQELVNLQNGLCAICMQPPTQGRGKRLHVDHDHNTGKRRGLLCHACNVSLGGFKDSPELLAQAIEYLEKHK